MDDKLRSQHAAFLTTETVAKTTSYFHSSIIIEHRYFVSISRNKSAIIASRDEMVWTGVHYRSGLLAVFVPREGLAIEVQIKTLTSAQSFLAIFFFLSSKIKSHKFFNEVYFKETHKSLVSLTFTCTTSSIHLVVRLIFERFVSDNCTKVLAWKYAMFLNILHPIMPIPGPLTMCTSLPFSLTTLSEVKFLLTLTCN